MRELPLVVLVSGEPASGKSTLARALARQLRLPLVSRDSLTEALAETLQCPSRQLVQPSFASFWRLVGDQVATGVGAVAETNLHRGVSEPAVRDLARNAAVVLVHCATRREVSLRRFRQRLERGERHWCFEDGQRLERLDAGAADDAWERAQPLALHLPLLVVDTTDGYRPDLSAIVAFIGSAQWPAAAQQPNAAGLEGGAFYDDLGVFDTYWQHRAQPTSPNELIEEPLIVELIGAVHGLRVLDLGCGDATLGRRLLADGCASYLGIDASRRMVDLARAHLRDTRGQVRHARIEQLAAPNGSFDLVVSRLALHYVEDLERVLDVVHRALRPRGRLVFSVEHPVITACDAGWDQSGPRGSWLVDNYFINGRRETSWLGGRVVKYHRPLEDYLSLVERAGFRVDAVREGRPEPRRFASSAELRRRQRIPLFLVIGATRRSMPRRHAADTSVSR